MIFDNIRIAFAALRANKMRSVLTTLGIIIGVGAVIGVVSIVQGLNQTIAKQLEGVGATFIQVVPKFDRGNPTAAGRDVKLTYDDGKAILEEASAISEYDPVLFRSGTVHYRDRHDDVTVFGVGASHQEVDNQWVQRGRFFSALDMERHAQVCLVGVDTVKNLGLGPNPIGKEITLGSMSLTVVGEMEKQGQMFGQNRDETVLVPITTAGDLYGVKALDQLVLAFQAKNADDVDLAKEQITQILRRRHHIAKGTPDDFEVRLQEELKKTVGNILGSVTAVVGAVVGISLLVGGIGIMNIMLVSVTERTREIGVRKAVGARRSDILVQFLVEAVALSCFGGAIGILLGWGLGVLGARMIPDFPPAYVPPWAIAIGFGFAFIVGVVFGTYPAAKASALDPIEALRYE
jgi:putative ABC transport system permease protein